MKVTHEHYEQLSAAVEACAETTAYTRDDIDTMSASGLCIMQELHDLDGTTVVAKDYKGEDCELTIKIKCFRFGHNTLSVYADSDVLRYFRFAVGELWKEDEAKPKTEAKPKREIRITSNGYGTALVFHYDW